jgi:hypothetical protein
VARVDSGPLTLLKSAYPQFHPSNAGELRALVLANRNAPVSPGCGRELLSDVIVIEKVYSPADTASVPRLPTYGSSMDHVAISALGIPITARITCWGRCEGLPSNQVLTLTLR